MELNRIYNMDCLEGMKEIPDESIDCIICDLPYGVLNRNNESVKWDVVIPFDKLWEQYHRVCKLNAPVILFGSEPFSSMLRVSNLNEYGYDWIWKKQRPTNFYSVKYSPLKEHETISVFYRRKPTYNPQGVKPVHINSGRKAKSGNVYGKYDCRGYIQTTGNYPRSILAFNTDMDKDRIHPTQKPVDLLRYLIRTYSNPGDTILDNCMGSGTTAVAAVLENRKFIGFETNKEYFDKANARLKQLTGPFYIYGNIGV